MSRRDSLHASGIPKAGLNGNARNDREPDGGGSAALHGRRRPLSPAQQHVWFLSQLKPDSPAFNHRSVWRLEGRLNSAALERAVNGVVSRHEALRTSFPVISGGPVQLVTPTLTVDLPVVDLTGLTRERQRSHVQQWIHDDGQRPFDVALGPLLRSSLLQLTESDHLLVLTVHSAVFDAWSDTIFHRDLATLYAAFAAGRSSPLPDLPVQYGDWSDLQWQRLEDGSTPEQLAFWKRQLEGRPRLLDLPVDRPRPAVQTWRGACLRDVLPAWLAHALRSLSRREGVDLFVTLLAAFQTFLYRWTGQDDVVVGSPASGRTNSNVMSLIGCFANSLVLRTDLSGNPGFAELLGRVREVTTAAYAHQDLPIKWLLDELQPERDLSHAPVFQVMFVLENTSDQKFELPELSLTRLPVESEATTFDLTLFIKQEPESLSATWEYNTDLFDAPTISRMMGHFRTLLEGVVRDPHHPIATLPVLSAGQRRQLLVEWNQTQTADNGERCIHQMFEARAERTPEAIAVVFERVQVSYGALNCRANQLAHRLRALGVGSDVRVGICVERSVEMIVGILGILKAGGAYVPLDPSYPQERLAFMLNDARVPLLLTQARLLGRIPETSAQILCLDSNWKDIAREREDNPHHSTTGDDLIYVIYTSGSTGTPKGVMVSQKSASNYVAWISTEFGIGPEDRVLQFASLAFDTSVEEIFPTLATGATLVLRTDEMLSSTHGFLQECRDMSVTVLDLPTAFWHELTAGLAETPVFPPSVRLVVIGGERAQRGPLTRWRQNVGQHVRLTNTYGPTEATVAATFCDLVGTVSNANWSLEVPIGKPVQNVQIYILDPHLEPVPVGVRGELHIGGTGVARGYLNDRDTTEQKFVVNPFGQDTAARIYKTGDLARYLPDGNIEFLGRVDQQVKLRGFRIELGEIEFTLVQHPAIREAVVMAHQDSLGEMRLVAYLVANSADAFTTVDLSDFLKRKLPAHMVPATFVSLDALPLTPNGKVNRQALPEPPRSRIEPSSAMLEPRSMEQLQLIRIWEQVLGINPIGVNDNFFELGGDSLRAVSLFTQIEKLTGRNLPLATLFQAPTIARLAVALRDTGWPQLWTSLVPIRPSGSKSPFFCVHGVGGNVLGYSALARHLGPDQPVYGLQAIGLDGLRPPQTQIEQMATHYISEICRLQPFGPYAVGGHSVGGVIAFEVAQQLVAHGHEVAVVALLDAFNPAYLSTMPRLSFYRHQASMWSARGAFHLRRLLFEPHRIAYVRQKAHLVKLNILRSIRPKLYRSLRASERPLPRALHNVHEASYFADAVYLPRRYPGRVILFRANVRGLNDYRDQCNGWQDLCEGGVEVYEVPGDHSSMLEEPHVRTLARKLATCLEKSQRLAALSADGARDPSPSSAHAALA